MKKNILQRYEKTQSGDVIIDISTEKVEDLYNNFDKKSHFLKKDLNQDLVDYIIECVGEIETEKFIIRFNFESETNQEYASKLKNSVNNYFSYLQEYEFAKMMQMAKKSAILLFLGAGIAAISVFVNQSELMQKSIVFAVVAEGLTVAAWVSLWEALAIFLIKWMPYKKKILVYKQIANAEIVFNFA